jgi:hypothetical protein
MLIVYHHSHGCWLAGETHLFELPEGAIRPEIKEYGNVFGCGLVLDPGNNLAIFFTLNGMLMGELVMDFLRIYNKKITHVCISNLCFIIIYNYIMA